MEQLRHRLNSSSDSEGKQEIAQKIQDLELKVLQLQDYTDRGFLKNAAIDITYSISKGLKTLACIAIGLLIIQFIKSYKGHNKN